MIKTIREIYRKHKIIFQKQGLKPMLTAIWNSAKLRMYNVIRQLIIKTTKVDEKTMIFQSHGDFCDNARALYEYMLQNGYGKKYKLIWFVSNPKLLTKYKNSQVKFIKFPFYNKKEEIVFQYYKNKAKIFFFTHPGSVYHWKSDQKVVNLSHGCGCKKAKGNLNIGKLFDIDFTIGKFHKNIESICFGCDSNKLLDLGYPRNDILVNKKFTNLQNRQKTIIWMPTFRKCDDTNVSDNYIQNETGLPLIDTKEQLVKLDTFLKYKNVKTILKIHHLQADIPVMKTSFQNIEILTDDLLLEKGIQLYELVAQTDALITDYSSIAYDYLLLDRPIAFILSDYEKYEISRGFSFPNPKKYMPGHHIYKFEELLSFIDSIAENKDDFVAERAKIRDLTHTYTDGKSSERILNYLNITK